MVTLARRRHAGLVMVGLAIALATQQLPAEQLPAEQAPAWRWPVADPDLSATFGTHMGGFVHRGVQLDGSEPSVHPVFAGVVVASVSQQSGRASGLGSYVVVDHDHSFRSVYAHLEPDGLPAVGDSVGPETRIGTIGSSGQIDRRSLRLYMIDLESGEYVNPLLLLPDVRDHTPPQIAAVYAADGQTVHDLRPGHELAPGSYEILAHITDRSTPSARAPRFAPYTVRFVVAGQQSFAVTKDRMTTDEGRLRLEPDGVTVGSLYDSQGLYRLGSIEVGPSPIELTVIARDIAGNETLFAATVFGIMDGEAE